MITVDEEDQDVLHAHYWRVRADGYIVARCGTNTFLLHREIMRKHGLLEDGKEVDHVDKYGPKSDCRKSNLRVVTHADNLRNGVEYPRQHALPRCVYLTHGGRYYAKVQYNDTRHYLGTYETLEEATHAVQKFRKERSDDRSEP